MERRRYEPTDFDVFIRRLAARIKYSARSLRLYQRELKSFVNHSKRNPKRQDFKQLALDAVTMLIPITSYHAKQIKKTYFYYQSPFNYKRGFDFF